MHCSHTPPAHPVGIGAMLQQIAGAVDVMPVMLANQHHGQAVDGELAALDQHLQRAVVVGLRRVIYRFVVVGVGAALEAAAESVPDGGQRRGHRKAPTPIRGRADDRVPTNR